MLNPIGKDQYGRTVFEKDGKHYIENGRMMVSCSLCGKTHNMMSKHIMREGHYCRKHFKKTDLEKYE